jgi:hypothetical protein
MARRRKLRKCRICKKSPVWRGGDVKNPGPYCKRCYHKHVWSSGQGADDDESVADRMVDYLSWLTSEAPYGFDERLYCPEPTDVYAESLLGLPLGPDADEWEWICRTARGGRERRRDSYSPLEPYPDADEWAWICATFRSE